MIRTLQELGREQSPEADSTSYAAVILAATSAQPPQWAVAFSLLADMTERGIMPQMATCSLLLMESELRGIVHAECGLLQMLPQSLDASLQAASGTGTDTKQDARLLVLQAAAQRMLCAGNPAACTNLLEQLDQMCWTPLAEALWQMAGNPPRHPSLKSGFAGRVFDGLRAGRAKELRLCRHVFASATMGDAWSVCQASCSPSKADMRAQSKHSAV